MKTQEIFDTSETDIFFIVNVGSDISDFSFNYIRQSLVEYIDTNNVKTNINNGNIRISIYSFPYKTTKGFKVVCPLTNDINIIRENIIFNFQKENLYSNNYENIFIEQNTGINEIISSNRRDASKQVILITKDYPDIESEQNLLQFKNSSYTGSNQDYSYSQSINILGINTNDLDQSRFQILVNSPNLDLAFIDDENIKTDYRNNNELFFSFLDKFINFYPVITQSPTPTPTPTETPSEINTKDEYNNVPECRGEPFIQKCLKNEITISNTQDNNSEIWTDTGIDLNPGDLLYVKVRGCICTKSPILLDEFGNPIRTEDGETILLEDNINCSNVLGFLNTNNNKLFGTILPRNIKPTLQNKTDILFSPRLSSSAKSYTVQNTGRLWLLPYAENYNNDNPYVYCATISVDPAPVKPTPTATPTPTVTPTTSLTPTTTPNQSNTPTPTITPTVSVSHTVTPTVSITNTATPTVTTTPTITSSLTPTPSVTSTVTPTISNTPSNTPSSTVTPTPTATYVDLNKANYNNQAFWNGYPGVTTVGTNGKDSYYGTYDQTGLAYEWTDETFSGNKIIRGGAYLTTYSSRLSISYRTTADIRYGQSYVGFRIGADQNVSDNYLDFVDISDIGNPNHLSGFGSVSYEYKVSKFLITNAQYVEFLNSVATIDTYGLYNSSMTSVPVGGIDKIGSSYYVKTNMGNKPIVYLTWFNAARYCNWLQNGKPVGNQDSSTTEDGAYTLNGATYGIKERNINAQYYLLNEDEWVKAAFYNSSSYYNFATQSNTTPTPVTANSSGDGVL